MRKNLRTLGNIPFNYPKRLKVSIQLEHHSYRSQTLNLTAFVWKIFISFNDAVLFNRIIDCGLYGKLRNLYFAKNQRCTLMNHGKSLVVMGYVWFSCSFVDSWLPWEPWQWDAWSTTGFTMETSLSCLPYNNDWRNWSWNTKTDNCLLLGKCFHNIPSTAVTGCLPNTYTPIHNAKE